MAAPKKYTDDIRERATRLAVEARRDPASSVGAIRRIAELEREVRELRRANQILKSAASFFAAELDRPSR